MLLNIDKSTHKELLVEWNKCQKLWSKYSCDCFGFYINSLYNKIVDYGGWCIKN